MTASSSLRGIARAAETIVLVAWLVVATLVIVLRYAVLPNADRWRGDLERAASRASGETVAIGAIDASWRGLAPTMTLKDVTVVDRSGAKTLAFSAVHATLAWRSLVALSPRFASLAIDDASLLVRRDVDGQLFVAGYPIRRKAVPDDRALEWLLAQDDLRIRGGTLVWRDETPETDATHAGPRQDLVLTDLAFALSRAGLQHRAALRATPPASLAAPLDLRASIDHPLLARAADEATWSGTVYADVGTGDIVAWKEWLPLPSTIDAGHGRARAWMTFAPRAAPAGVFARSLADRVRRPIPADLDRIASVTVDLAIDDLAVRWGAMADAPEYAAIASIDGRLEGSQSMREQRVAAIRMAIEPRAGATVPPTDFEMRRTIGATPDDESGTATLGAIDIGVSLGLVPEPLVPPAIAGRVAALKPRGTLTSVVAKWTGPIAAPRTFEGRAGFARVAIAPQAPTPEAIAAAAREIVGANGLVRKPRKAFGQPGVENLAGTLIATRTGGASPGTAATTQVAIAIAGDDVRVDAPGLFDDPRIVLAHLAANVGIQAKGPDLEVTVDHATLDNPDLAGSIDLRFRHGPESGGVAGGRGWLDLDARLSRADVAAVPRYLPNIIGERARVYLGRSLVAGRIDDASLRMRGPVERLNLREMPGALATPNPVGVSAALVAIRDRPARAAAATENGTADAKESAQRGEAPDLLFHAAIHAHDATFRYGPGRRPEDPPPANGKPPSPAAFIPWPAFEDVDADVLFDFAKLTVHARRARVYGYRMTDITAELPALADPQHVLRVVGHGTGPMQDLLRFMKESPVSFWLRHFTDNAKATGDAALALALDLPLTHPRDTEVAGSLAFARNDLALNAIVPPIYGVAGRLDFSDRGLAIDGLTATALGGPLRIDAATHPDGWIVLDANGTIDVAGLQKSSHEADPDGIATPLSDAVDRASTFLAGSTPYRVALRVRSKRVTDLAADAGAPPPPPSPAQPDLLVESDLQGLAIALPEPLAKPADARWPLRIALSRTVGTSADVPDTEDVRATLADRVAVRIGRRRNADGQLEIVGADYRVGAAAAADERAATSTLAVDLPALDVDAWRVALQAVRSTRARGDVAAAPVRARPTTDVERLLPDRATLRVGVVTAYGRTIDHVAVDAARDDAGWRADIAADQVEGRLSYLDVSGHVAPKTGVAPPASGKLVARLARLSIPASTAAATAKPSVSPGTDSTTAVGARPSTRLQDFPAIDVVVDRFELRGRELGRLEVVADNVEDEGGRAWQLRTLGLTTPEARFAAHGAWEHADVGTGTAADIAAAPADPRERTRLDFTLDAADAGKLLDRLGVPRTIGRGTAHLSGDVAWQGSPTTIDFGTMTGTLKLAADRGQFLKAEPGAAKLLNILSLQGLARHLTLDFSDVFSPGFAFDTVRADIAVDHGVATTEDFTMRGPQALVTMAGSADLGRETARLHVRVEPQINAGAASLGVAVINPVIGLATFAAQYLFKDRLSRALAFEYNVDGPWTKPDVTKIDRHGVETRVVPKSAASTSDPVGAAGRVP